MVVDFRRARPELSTISILGDKVQLAESYKYLGVHIIINWTGSNKRRLSTRRVRADSAS